MSPAYTCLLSKLVNAKKTIVYQEGLNKALSDVTEHQISLRKSSKHNTVILTYVDRFKNQK